MRKGLCLHALCFVLLGLTCCLAGNDALAQTTSDSSWGEIRSASQNLNVRQKRDHRSEHVLTLKKGERVKVDFLKNGWYAVFSEEAVHRDLSLALGFAKAKYLQRVAAEPAPLMESEHGDTAPSTAATAVDAGSARVADEPFRSPKVVAEVQERPEDVPDAGPAGKEPVRITADRLTYNDAQRTVTFSGNVEAVHEGMQLWSERLTAHFSKQGEPGEEIDRIVASGGVTMRKDEIEGKSDTVTYQVKEALLLMHGSPVITEGKNKVTGKVIKFYVREKRSEVVGGSGKRVEAILFAPEGMEAP